MKLSKKGRLALKYEDGDYTTVKRDEIAPEENKLVPVFRNGQLLKKWDFAELKERSEREVPESYFYDYVAPLREAAKGGATPVGA
jgi:nicotinamide phosphoribosyltransferase